MKTREIVKRKLPLFIAVAIYAAVCLCLIGCPIKFLTGIPCPGCGMTRAIVSALRLDFAGAFSLHPLFPIAPLFIVYLFTEDLIPKGASKYLGITFGVLFIGVYVFRIFFTNNPVVSIDPGDGFVVKSIKHIISFFGG